MPVYFIRAGSNGPVKIGYAKDPAVRLKDLQTAHYAMLYLLREVTGHRLLEARFHWHYRKSRVRGEWFRFSPDMLDIKVNQLELRPVLNLDLRPIEPAVIPKLRPPIIDQAIYNAGGVGALAKHVGLNHNSVSMWRRVPAKHVLTVERVTGINRSLLRPDVYPPNREVAATPQGEAL